MFDDWAWKSYNRVLEEVRRRRGEPTPFKSPAQKRYKRQRRKNDIYTRKGGHKKLSTGSPFTGKMKRFGTDRLRFENLKEIIDDGIDFSSLEAKEGLSDSVWEEGQLKEEVSEKLKMIADDFTKSLSMDIEIKDVLLVGSMAGYNHSKYSDIDLHIILDFNDISLDKDLLRKYFILAKSKWNKNQMIILYGHEVEVYVENVNDERIPSAVYSVLRGEWINEPSREGMIIDYEGVTKKVNEKMDGIDELQTLYENEEYEEAYELGAKLRAKMRNFRQSGLDREGEYSNENLTFKVLRRSGDLERMNEYTKKSYIRMRDRNFGEEGEGAVY
jgi:predicted nucleotidyltransferase